MIVYVNTLNNGTLNLRQEASQSTPILAQIPNGTQLEVEQVNNEWGKTTYKEKVGYVMLRFLTNKSDNINKDDLKRIYNSLSETLKLIDEVLKK